MGPTRLRSGKAVRLSLAALIIANSCYSYFWLVAPPPALAQATPAPQSPSCGHEKSSCHCLRCAGPSECPCDHGTSSQGSVCGASQEERPLSAPDSAPPVPAKLMCEIPHRQTMPEVWTPRSELALQVSIHLFPKPVDKVPIFTS